MSHSLIITVTLPLKSESVIEHADTLIKAKAPLDNLLEYLPGATHTARIVKGRDAPAKARKPRLAAAE